MLRYVKRAACGVNVAAITPRREGPEADLATLFDLIDFLCAAGVDGICLMGSTGEFLHFGLEERMRLVGLAIKRSRVPVLVGVGHSTFDGAVALARDALDAGAAALLVMPPYFFRYGQSDIREFYLGFARELNGGAPLILYNIPQFSSEIEAGTAIELLATGRFAGIKDSSGRWDDFVQLKAAREKHHFYLLVGNDAIYARAREAGADGVISGCACAVPELLVAMDRAIRQGNAGAAARLDARLQEFIEWIQRFPAPVGVREAVALRGIKTGPHAVPLGEEAQARLPEFREWFRGWLPAVIEESRHAQA